jgi:carnitine O-acetyltransferase
MASIKAKAWPRPMIESHGDYREEAFLETLIGGKLYENQKKMPKLPVPPIQETLDRLLPTVLPLAKNDQERAALIKSIQDFPEQAKLLQKRLLERKEEMSDSSWLQLWWNTLGYLQVRDPVVVNVSYFFGFIDDPTIDATFSSPNVQRGAALLFAAAEFRKMVVTGQLPFEQVGKKKTPMCATAYKYQFHATRIPHRGQDSYRIYDPSKYTHCIVARKGHFFSMELVDPETEDPLSVLALEEQLQQILNAADSIVSGFPSLGILTTQNRDDWADARDALIRLGGSRMEESLTKLESGALLLNLDDEAPVSRQECGEIFWTGGLNSGSNRWFDKSIQLMVENNGKAGGVFEHSMMDGAPLIVLCNYITGVTYRDAKRRSLNKPTRVGNVENIFEEAIIQIDRSQVLTLESKGMCFCRVRTIKSLCVVHAVGIPWYRPHSHVLVYFFSYIFHNSTRSVLQTHCRSQLTCTELPGLWG